MIYVVATIISRSGLGGKVTQEFAEKADGCDFAVGDAADEVDHDSGARVGLTDFAELGHHDVSGDEAQGFLDESPAVSDRVLD